MTTHTTIAAAQAMIDALPAVQAGAIRITLSAVTGWVIADVSTADMPHPRRAGRLALASAGPDRIVEAVIDRIRPQDEHAAMWRHYGLAVTVTDACDADDAAPGHDAAVAWYTLSHTIAGLPPCVAIACTPHGGVESCCYYPGGRGSGVREELPIPAPEDDIAELLGDLILRDSVTA